MVTKIGYYFYFNKIYFSPLFGEAGMNPTAGA